MKEIAIYDNFFSEKIHKEVYNGLINSNQWSFAGGGFPNMFWHIDGLEQDQFFRSYLFKIICDKLDRSFDVKRIYCNGQTACQSGAPHMDDGDITFLYYPNLEWEDCAGGDTFFIEDDEIIKTVSYKPNRAVLFPAKIMHYAGAPNRFIIDLRISLAYKLLYNEALTEESI